MKEANNNLNHNLLVETPGLFNQLISRISTDIIALYSNDGILKTISPSVTQLLGYSFDEVKALDPHDIIHPVDIHHMVETYESLRESRNTEVSDVVFRIKHKNKSWRWVELNAEHVPLGDKSGIYIHLRDITKYKRDSKNKPMDQTRHIKQAADQAREVICVFDDKGRFEYVNKSSFSLWGYNPDELIGRPYMDFVIEKDKAITEEVAQKLHDGIALNGFVNRYKNRSGKTVSVAWDAQYNIAEKKLYGIARLAVENKEASETIKNRERRFSTLIQNSTDGLALLDLRGRILEISNPGRKILEFNKNQGKLRDHVCQDDLALVNEAFFDVANDPRNIKTIEYRYKLPDDSYKWIEATFQNQLHMPEVNAIVLNFREITQRKKSEEAVKRSEVLRRTIMNSSLDAIICIDINGLVVLWNDQAEKLFGWERKEILGKNMADVILPSRYVRLYLAVVQHYINSGNDDRMNSLFETTALNRKKKEFPVEASVIPIEVNGYTMFCAFVRDISVRKHHQQEKEDLLKDIQKRAEELAVSNAELEQFAYIASHDLQEPLRMITSFLSQLEKKYSERLDEKAKKYIFFATDGASRMRRIILDLLEYSRVGRGKHDLVKVDMEDLLNEVLLFHNLTIKRKKAVIEWKDLPTDIVALKTPLEQVFQNLISNSLKYHDPKVIPKVKIKARERPNHWEFTLKDNGIGIDPQYFDKIFILFQRLHYKEQYSGTGIGLAICKKIVEGLGGEIWVESKPGKGSAFHFTIAKQKL